MTSASPRPARRQAPSAVGLSRDDRRTSATTQVLLDTAERLFAEKGVEHVSLRQIVLASGHRNVAAMQYHFGSRTALVTRVLQRRREYINHVRNQALDELLAREPAPDVRTLIGLTTRALADTLREQPWGRHYISVLAQATLSPQLREDMPPLAATSGLQRVHMLLRQKLQHTPAETVEQNLTWLTQTLVYSLAQWWYMHEKFDAAAYDAYVANLIDFCSGALSHGTGSATGT